MKKFKKVDEEWVDIHDDALMVSLGIRPRDYVVPNFSKTIKEKKLLKKLKHNVTNTLPRNWYGYREPSFPLNTKIIVYLKRNHNYPHQIYSRNLWMYQIPQYLTSFHTKKGTCLVDYYIYNGIRYNATELPVNPYVCNGRKK